MEYADIRYNNGMGALVCNRCFLILEYGFEHEDKFHFCSECEFHIAEYGSEEEKEAWQIT